MGMLSMGWHGLSLVVSWYVVGSFAFFFFFNDTPPPEFYPLSLHDALPISARLPDLDVHPHAADPGRRAVSPLTEMLRSEEHTSELQSLRHLVCRLLLE